MKFCPLCIVGATALIGTGLFAVSGGFNRAEAAAATATTAAAEGWKLDAVHSSVLFSVRHKNAATFYGRFNVVSGSFKLDPADTAKSFVDITVPADSVDSNNAKRNDHLKSQDFFSAKEFPNITFKSKSVKKLSETKFEIAGDLTLRGKTAPLTITAENPSTSKELAALETTFTIKRSDFGITYGAGALGEEVTLIIALEAAK